MGLCPGPFETNAQSIDRRVNRGRTLEIGRGVGRAATSPPKTQNAHPETQRTSVENENTSEGRPPGASLASFALARSLLTFSASLDLAPKAPKEEACSSTRRGLCQGARGGTRPPGVPPDRSIDRFDSIDSFFSIFLGLQTFPPSHDAVRKVPPALRSIRPPRRRGAG